MSLVKILNKILKILSMICHIADNSIRPLLLVQGDCDENSKVNSLVTGQNPSVGTEV